MISREKIDYIKGVGTEHITEVIGEFVQLKKRGANFVGLSPFANERTPSFTVHPAKGIFKDFSSGKGGDVLNFLMEVQSWRFTEALKYLAKRFGIDVDIDTNDVLEYVPQKPNILVPVIEPSTIPSEVVMASVGNYQGNALFEFLSERFGASTVEEKFNEYYVGTLNDWVIFWQVTTDFYARSGKYIKYLPTGKRCRDSKASWEHSKIRDQKPVYPDFNLVQCLFGEHLISEDVRKPIAIVESEKTAIICSMAIPKYIWLACGSKNGLNDTKCQVLRNRSVTLYPDVGCYDEWSEQAKKYGFSISNTIEREAGPNDQGLDIADFLLR